MDFLFAEISMDCLLFMGRVSFCLMQFLPLHVHTCPSSSLPSSHTGPLLDLVVPYLLPPEGMLIVFPLPGISSHLLNLYIFAHNFIFSRILPLISKLCCIPQVLCSLLTQGTSQYAMLCVLVVVIIW